MKPKSRLFVTLAFLAISIAAHAQSVKGAQPRKPAGIEAVLQKNKQTLEAHLKSFLVNDLDAIVSDYANDAVLIAPDGIHKGKREIRQFFASMFVQFPKGSSSIELDRVVHYQNMIYFTWHGKGDKHEVPFATDTMIIQNGKIKSQTYGGLVQVQKS